MTDSMNFGPDWIRNLSSEGTTGGGGAGGTKYQLADYRYGREEMLALFDKNLKPPISISNFKCLYSDTCLQPLALLPVTEEEQRVGWQGRPNALLAGPSRGRGGSLERGGRISRGRGYQYGRPAGYEAGWGNGEQPDWSPRKDYANQRTASDNWRRVRSEEDEWRNAGAPGRSAAHDKWTRSMSWRGDGDSEERTGPPERGGRAGWADNRAGAMGRKSWENDDHLPEWATENPTEGGGTFDEKGAFHNSDDEQPDVKPVKKESGFQKSVSLHQMSGRNQIQPPPMLSSKSVASLKLDETCLQKNDNLNENVSMDKRDIEDDQEVTNVRQQKKNSNIFMDERKKSLPNLAEKVNKEEMKLPEGLHKHHLPNEKVIVANGPINIRPDEPDFERLQEEYVLKLVVDEDLPKQVPNNYDVTNIQPPPNLATTAPILDKWYYQDPQGQMQGPFSNAEMAEWYKAGYFSNQLKVRRQCDERFYLLGELIGMCAGANPFQSGVRFPVLKGDNLPKIAPPPPAEPDMLPLQYLSQMAAFQAQAQARLLAEPWNVGMPPPELAAQRLMMQQQVTPDIQYLQQQPATNPLMHMINQMQQVNKLPGQGIVDKNPSIPPAMDAHMQLHNLLSMQNRLPGAAAAGVPGALPAGLTNLPPPEGLPNIPIQSNIPVSIGGNISMPRPTSRGSEQIPPNQNPDPISSLLKQLQQQQQQQQQQQKQSTNSQVETLWQQNSFNPDNGTAQWQSQNDVPVSMWDIPKPDNAPALTQSEKLQQALQPKPAKDKEKEQEALAKELKKKKELEEKQAKKEEEKRKQEQKRLEAERKMLEEKKRKEEERIKKELEKAKREAEEKRLRELEEKRRLKEQRKLEEEARKKAEEMKKLEEEKLRQELKEKEARRQEEEKRLQQEHQRQAKAAPWCQANSNMGLSLAEIQKAEREKRAIDAALQIQRQQQEKEQQQQSQQEKTANPQFNWAKKPVEARKVKSLAEIQAEEQEKLSKQVAESRLHKEKEPAPVTNNTGTNIWSSQNLTWASSSVNWSNSGFWDDSSSKQQQPAAAKPSAVTKSNSASNFTSASKSQPQKPAKAVKPAKKEEAAPNKSNHHHHNNNNEPSTDEFMSWCYKTLSNISTNVDIPTFVTFLRDIESAYDVKEYCKEYLGDNNATHQFALNFLEKRRSFKPKNNAHKDDMCAPAPAITPSLQHSTEFQEVKGKNKKNKKSKMTKVDSRILGFNVTSAPDRINVGDRDYGDTS